MSASDVIFACASGAGQAGVAVIRVSGPGAGDAFDRLTGRPPPPPRQASLRTLRDPGRGEAIDRALTLFFPGPASFTGEDVVELHVHGGMAVIDGVAEALAQLPGFRPAEPGEFSRRAFRNGKMDLAAAEGVADLIAADTAAARRQALWQMQGGLTALHAGWRDRLIAASALGEAALDFSDEPVPDDLMQQWNASISEIRTELARYLEAAPVTERLADGFRVVLAGAPNAGKSSLLNALARREAAIVTPQAGTTRDIIDVRLDLGGYPVTISDTAGLRKTEDAIEREGVKRARAAMAAADLVVEVIDLTAPLITDDLPKDRIVFCNKRDLAGSKAVFTPPDAIEGSAVQGDGLERLEIALTAAARQAIENAPPPAATRARHRAAIEDAVAALDRAMTAPAPELAAEDLRLAGRALGRIAGIVDVEDVLDRIFGSFCIGK